MSGKMIVFAFTLAVVVALANAGSICPEREMLYPCHCTNVQLTKKTMFTIVSCRHLPQTDSLSRLALLFRTMQIDRFIIYDSFWESGLKDTQKKLPENWLSNLHIVELEIIDTALSNSFACDIKGTCRNNVLRQLTIRNSSLTDVPICQQGSQIFFWTSCLNRLQHFQLSGNELKKIDKTLFPGQMTDLLTVNLSRNAIEKIDNDSFSKLVKIHSLDLSYNRISSLPEGMFGSQETVITYLDVSWNYIKSLPSSIFKYTPFLVTFGASNNQLTQLHEDEWKHLSDKAKLIDLKDNPIVCDCSMRWVNCSLHINTVMLGLCSNENYTTTPLRRASVYMLERCDDKGILQNRQDKKKFHDCVSYLKMKKSNYIPSDGRDQRAVESRDAPVWSQPANRRNRQSQRDNQNNN